MKPVLLCFVLFVLFAVNAQAQKTLEKVNPDSDTLQLVIDIDETVRIEIAPSDKKTSSVTVKTNVKEVTVQREDTKYIVKKVKPVSHNTPQTTKKPNPPTATPTPAHDESNAFRLSSSSFAVCLSLIAVACHLVFVGERKWVATTTTVLLLVIFALCSSGSTFVNASTESHSKSQVTVRVYLPESVQTLKITQKNGRKGLIDVVGDPSSPLAINTFRFTTSTNTQLKDITFSSCSRVFIQSQANVLVDNFQAPTSGSCSITFKAGKQMLATMADGYLGGFTLSCQQGGENNKQNNACSTNAVGSAVKHSTSSFTTSVNTTEGDTLCTGATGYNILSASGTKVNVDFGSSADCFPVVTKSNPPNAGTPFVQPSTSALPASPAVSSLPASKSAIPPASASISVAPASASTSAAPASASTSAAPASASTSVAPASASTSAAPASASTSAAPASASTSAAPASASTSAAPASASTSAAPASASPSSWVESACRTVNGIRWCYNPSKCGESCEDVCKFFGFSITIDDTTWFNAQNDLTKCRNIASAFGISSVNLDVWSYGCLEDAPGIHSDPSKLIGPLYCSTLDTCPGKHRTATDQLGADCATESRKSICPCQ